MKFLGTLCLALVCLLGQSQAKAEFVIDDFVSSSDTGFVDTTRSGVTTSNVLPGFLFSAPGFMTVIANSAGGFAEFDLNFADPGVLGINPTGWGYFSTIDLGGLTVAGDWELTISATNGVSEVGTLKNPVSLLDGSTSASVNLYDLDHASNLNNLQSLTFRFTNLADNAGNRVLQIGSFTAVPEPQSLALLGLTCAGGAAFRLRRKKS